MCGRGGGEPCFKCNSQKHDKTVLSNRFVAANCWLCCCLLVMLDSLCTQTVWCRPGRVYSQPILVLRAMSDFQQNRVCKKSGVFDLRHCRESLFVASWNVHSLVECAGDARICGVSKTSKPHFDFPVDCKLNLLVKELQHYRVTIAGLKETKWLESDVWPADNGWVFLSCLLTFAIFT